VLVGGGLQAGLLVLAIRHSKPDATIAVLERESRLGGNHTWCFHSADISAAAREWIAPAIAHSWESYSVRFPDGERVLDETYVCLTPQVLESAVERALSTAGSLLTRGDAAAEIEPTRVKCSSGRQVTARLVIDARGPAELPREGCGFQKFLGLECELAAPHGLVRPLLMDATVDQTDGYRFFYLLPLAVDRLLVEDTRFTNAPDLDRDAMRRQIDDYCRGAGWNIRHVHREEEGVLPMPWTGDRPSLEGGVLRAGYRGGWSHPGTGYSLPVAARLAEAVARSEPETIRAEGVPQLRKEHDRQAAYYRLLNRLLFRWYPPRARWQIFARFYRMPLPLIRRFYALRLRLSDRVRLLVGRPPRGFSIRYRVAPGGET
jgi:lycopene beta-cyclase